MSESPHLVWFVIHNGNLLPRIFEWCQRHDLFSLISRRYHQNRLTRKLVRTCRMTAEWVGRLRPTWQKQLGLCKNHHSSQMKCDLHTLDLGLQHSGCFWKLLLSSLPILLFLASGCSQCSRHSFSLFVEAEATASRVGSTLCVASPSPSPPPSANLPTINRGWKKSLHDCLGMLLLLLQAAASLTSN